MLKKFVALFVVSLLTFPLGSIGAVAVDASDTWESSDLAVLTSYFSIDSDWTADAQVLVGESFTFSLRVHNSHNTTAEGRLTFKALGDDISSLVIEREVEDMGEKFWRVVELGGDDSAVLIADYSFAPGTVELKLRVTFGTAGVRRFAAWVDATSVEDESGG